MHVLCLTYCSLDLEGYVKHPLMALVIMVEYTLRTKAKEAGRSKQQQILAIGSSGKRTDAEGLPQEQSALQVILGTQIYVPFDGKHLRLRNTPRDVSASTAVTCLSDASQCFLRASSL